MTSKQQNQNNNKIKNYPIAVKAPLRAARPAPLTFAERPETSAVTVPLNLAIRAEQLSWRVALTSVVNPSILRITWPSQSNSELKS